MRLNQGFTPSHLKKRIWVQDQGGAGFQTGGILAYVEDLKSGSNKDIGPKDFFEMACLLTLIKGVADNATTTEQTMGIFFQHHFDHYAADTFLTPDGQF